MADRQHFRLSLWNSRAPVLLHLDLIFFSSDCLVVLSWVSLATRSPIIVSFIVATATPCLATSSSPHLTTTLWPPRLEVPPTAVLQIQTQKFRVLPFLADTIFILGGFLEFLRRGGRGPFPIPKGWVGGQSPFWETPKIQSKLFRLEAHLGYASSKLCKFISFSLSHQVRKKWVKMISLTMWWNCIVQPGVKLKKCRLFTNLPSWFSVLIIHFYIELGQNMIQLNIQFKIE